MCCSLNREAWLTLITEKNVIIIIVKYIRFQYKHLQKTIPNDGLNGNESLCCHVLMGMKPAASEWSKISLIVTC